MLHPKPPGFKHVWKSRQKRVPSTAWHHTGRRPQPFLRFSPENSAMRLATLTNWAYGATVILSLASAAAMLFASSVQEDERAAVAQRFRLDQASSAVAADVTLLSDQARDYVITGAASHLAIYRGAISQLRSMEDRTRRLKDLGASTDELSALSDAMRRADTLQDEQKQAVAARERGDEDQARRILFGPEYDNQLDRVATDVER